MDKVYKLTLYNKNIYKEIDLVPDMKQVTIGTYYDNNIRIKKDAFIEDFYVALSRAADGTWEISGSENVYFYCGDLRKQLRMHLTHGDEFHLRYQKTNSEFLKLLFTINFDEQKRKFEDKILISKAVKIGGDKTSDIVLLDELAKDDNIVLKPDHGNLQVIIQKTQYGIYLNGNQVKKNTVVHNYDFIAIAGYQFYFKNGYLYTDLNEKMKLNHVVCEKEKAEQCFEYPLFNRNTRIMSLVPTEPIAVLDPPEKPEKPKNNLLMSIFPAFVMLILTIVIRGWMSSTSSNTFVIFSACTIGMGIITSIMTFFQGKKEYKKSVQEREEKYIQYIDEKEKQIKEHREQENEILHYNYPSMNTLLDRADKFSGDLFDRTDNDTDFLDVYLGDGEREAVRKVNYSVKEKFVSDDMLTYLPEQLMIKYRNLENGPIILKLKEASAVGIIGEESCRYELTKNIIVDLVCRQYADDLRIAFIMNQKQKEIFNWVRFLPHTKCDGNYVRMIACDTDSRTNLFENLYKELSRRGERIIKNKENANFVHLVIFVFESENLMTHPLSKFIQAAALINVTFIFLEDRKEKLPLGISEIIVAENKKGECIDTADNNKKAAFQYETIVNQQVQDMAVRLSPVYCKEISLEGNLVKSISLFEVLNIYSVEELDLSSRWEKSRAVKSLAAPLGVKSKNETVYLDIHEKAHGPHGLVAGTTGSGKSEILQSYILSMVTLYHPYEVGFVIIDFKGGGMANQFRHLPHLMGTITNIDGKQINRSLLSIKAELLKRQRCFVEAEVNHIDKYIMKYKNGEVAEPLPHLIIIVDEFAELKAEYPEFMKELISASRIGRSLGVHLILATQKPSGQVNDQIWSNARFKLCLKVQSPEDSNEMIKSPLAAEILEPGRAYLQVGNNEIFDLFQSGFSGAPEKVSSDAILAREYQLAEISFEGKRKTVFKQKADGEKGAKKTQLEALVDYVNGYCEEKNIVKLQNICLPPLPEIMNFPVEQEKAETTDFIAQIGLLDDPENQRQVPAFINFSQDNVLVIGSSQYGKTNLLQTIVRSLCTQYSASEVNIYILDFGSMLLRNFEHLNHVGGVIVANEDEKFKNLMKLLLAEIETRREILMSLGVSSFSAYRDAGFTELPQIVLLIDNYTAVREYYLQEEDPVMQICREGISVGISTVMANSQTAGMGYRYMANFAKRIVFYCNESGEYSNVIERCRTAPDNVAGRALTEIDRKIYEVQTYLSFNGEREIERIADMNSFVEFTNAHTSGKAKEIPVIPEILEMEALVENYKTMLHGAYSVPVGLYYDPITPIEIDLLNQGWFVIAGKDNEAKENLLSVIFQYLYENMFTCPADVMILDCADRKLSSFEKLGIVQDYSIDASDIIAFLEDTCTELLERYRQLETGELEIAEEALKLIVIRNQEALDTIAKDAATLKAYRELTGKLKAMKVCFIFMDVTNAPITYSASEIMKTIKETKNMFFFDELSNLKMVDVSTVTLRKFKKKLTAGDAYWLTGNEISKIKTVKKGGK